LDRLVANSFRLTNAVTGTLVLNVRLSTVVEIESKRNNFSFWYRNPQQPGQSSLGIAYLDGEEYKIVRPDFIFFGALEDGRIVADIIDLTGDKWRARRGSNSRPMVS